MQKLVEFCWNGDSVLGSDGLVQRFNERLSDHLNAEIVLGTVTNIKEGISWLAFTYLYIRMIQNPLAYGITHVEMRRDPKKKGSPDSYGQDAR